MKTFQFPLQKALNLRATQLGLAEAKFQEAAAAVAEADKQREMLLESQATAEAQVRRATTVAGEELAALDSFRRHARLDEKRLAQQRAVRVAALDERRGAMLEARRRLRLLERLKERRHAEWSAQAAKELEELASESYLACWARGHGPQSHRENDWSNPRRTPHR